MKLTKEIGQEFWGGSLDGTLPISFSATTQLHSSSFTFATLTPHNNNFSSDNESSEEEPKSLCWRIEKLPGTEPVGSAFQCWMGDGFPIHRAHVFHTINRFRKLHFNKRALEVMEWVIKERPYRPKELDYSYLLEFRTKLHGLLYNNLVIACLDKGMIRLSLASMKKMRELGHPISHLIFNSLIILHSLPNRRKAITRILRQMRADKVDPHVSTYNILMKIEANQHNIEGLVTVFGDMKRAQVKPKEIFFCILATAHAVARLYTICEAYVEAVEKSATGNNWSTLDKEIERTWGILQELPHVRSKIFVVAIEAFGRMGGLSHAEQLWIRKSTLWLEITLSIVETFAENGDIENAEKLFEELKKENYSRYTFVYNTLIKAYVKAKIYDPNLLKRMILGGSRPDSKTYSLLNLLSSFKPNCVLL
ncbi:Pentatricopeptide repeat-containing protein [Camellia lanceoleosa]|nr:Pentatricopeptide repeat-containing protein [Camellia lanceoleosa]